MPRLYPLCFEPILRRYLWGGRRLETILGKSLGEGPHFAESWEIVDHREDISRIKNGPLAGSTLRDLVQQQGPELFGQHHPTAQFPLLFKFLDAQKTLSVQVHPDDARAARLDPPDLGKTEAWVVVAAKPGSKIYAGLKPGVDRSALAREASRGASDTCLHTIEAQEGECVYLPAGTIHALGEGLMVAEIQQASDTIFRLFDWNRVDASGNSRPLHIAEALDAIDYDRGPVAPQQPQPTERPYVERLVTCEKFVLNRWCLDAPAAVGGDDRFHIVSVLEGEVSVAAPHQAPCWSQGVTGLFPAGAGAVQLQPGRPAVLLDIHLP